MEKFYDDITSFRHIRYPNVIITNPKHYIRLYKRENKQLLAIYGCHLLPSINELNTSLLASRVFDLLGPSFITTLDINLEDYFFTIDGHPIK